MRRPEALSPTALDLYQSDIEKYVRKYICETRLPYEPQTEPQAIGSSFDAFVKNELLRTLYGEERVKKGEQFNLETLFDSQTKFFSDKTWAWENGMHVFNEYKASGAFDALINDMKDTIPSFEQEVKAEVEMIDGTLVPLKGFPDCVFAHKNNRLVIVDWKCNNYCAKSKKSPHKYYINDRYNKGSSHKESTVENVDGLLIDTKNCFSKVNEKWATQICIYHWICGSPIGGEIIGQIEQLLGIPSTDSLKPKVRCVTYRNFISKDFQIALSEKVSKIWKNVESYNFFELNEEDTAKKINELDCKNRFLAGDNPLLKILANRKK